MTIDELRARRRELLARKKHELELQAAGKGDNMALFMVQEELLDINAHLRALMPGHRVGGKGRIVNDQFEKGRSPSDRQQFLDWSRENNSLDDEIDEGRRLMIEAVTQSLKILSPRQREVFELRQAGLSEASIAERLKVNPSTISRTLARSKKNLLAHSVAAIQQKKYAGMRLDLADPHISKIIISVLTNKQLVYMYLYYSEWLTLREISAITGTCHSSILRTIQRAQENICKHLGCEGGMLENLDVLDDLAYTIYSEIQDLDADAPLEVQSFLVPKETQGKHSGWPPKASSKSLERILKCWSRLSHFKRGQVPWHEHGRLYRALMERMRQLVASNQRHLPMLGWLLGIFQRLRTLKEKKSHE